MLARTRAKEIIVNPRVVIAWFTVSILLVANAHAGDGAACEQLWLDNSGQYIQKAAPDWAGLLKFWQQKAPECKSTGAYEAHLATIYFYKGQWKEGHDALAKARKNPGSYSNLIEVAGLMGESFELSAQSPVDEAKLRELGERTLAFADLHPDYGPGLAWAGGMATALHYHSRAISLLEKAFMLSKSGQKFPMAGVFRNATISYAALGKYDRAYRTAGAAIDENGGATADPEFMYALIKAEAELGYAEDAKQAAQLLAGKTPLVKSDPEFIELVASLNGGPKTVAP
jgi:tetratricopeptide (TPR) repeat protein